MQPPDELSAYLDESIPPEPESESFDTTHEEIIRDLKQQLSMGAREFFKHYSSKDFENFYQDRSLGP